MSILHGHICDTCGAVDRTHPDDGAPAGWYLVARLTSHGGWDEEREWHFCTHHCLTGWALDD